MFYLTTKKHEYLTKTWQQNDETYIFEVIIKKQTFLIKKIEKGENRVIHVTGGWGGQTIMVSNWILQVNMEFPDHNQLG